MKTKTYQIIAQPPSAQGIFEGVIEINPPEGDYDAQRIENLVNEPSQVGLDYEHKGRVIGTASVVSRDDGRLTVLGRLDLTQPTAQGVLKRMQRPSSDITSLREMSVEFRYDPRKSTRDASGVKAIHDATLVRVSMVHAGAQASQLVSVKSRAALAEPTWAGTSIPRKSVDDLRAAVGGAVEGFLDDVFDHATASKSNGRPSKRHADRVTERVDRAYALRDGLAQEATALGFPNLAKGLYVVVDSRIQTGRAEPKSLVAAVRKFVDEYVVHHNRRAEGVESGRVKRLVEELNAVPMRGSVPIQVDAQMRPLGGLAAATSVDSEETLHIDVASDGREDFGEIDARTMSPTSERRPEKASGPRGVEVVASVMRGASLLSESATRAQNAALPDAVDALLQASRDLRQVASGMASTDSVGEIIASVAGIPDQLRAAGYEVAGDNCQRAIDEMVSGTDSVTNAERVHGSVDTNPGVVDHREPGVGGSA